MDLQLIFSGFIIAFIIIFCYQCWITLIKNKLGNRVHFYVARDKNGTLWLYMNKPVRYDNEFRSKANVCLTNQEAQHFSLNKNDYANLKWEDEPLEVFVNIKD